MEQTMANNIAACFKNTHEAPAALSGDMTQSHPDGEDLPPVNEGIKAEIKLGIDNAIRRATIDHPSVQSVCNLEAAAIIADMRSYLYDEFDITDVDD